MGDERTDSDPLVNPERRGQIQVTAELLEAMDEPTNKSTLYRRANLNHVRGNRYLRAVLESGLAHESDDGRYALTDDGMEFVQRWRSIQDLIEG